ncbi:MAG: hypothetical protein RLP09_19460 [Sandaracinaceae bacterium]
MWRPTALACLVALAFGCDGAGGELDAGWPDVQPPVGDTGGDAVRGAVFYEDRVFDEGGFTGERVERPARGVRVQLWADGALVAEGFTDDDGGFSLARGGLDAGDAVTVIARAEAERAGHTVRVADRARRPSVYALEEQGRVDEAFRLIARADAEGGAFNVVDVSVDAFALYAPYVGEAAPTLTYRWERGRGFDCGSCYGDDEISLGGGFEDTDEYDDDIVLHELGHYFVDHYGRDTSPAGVHRDRQVEPELAYGEGLAYFFAAMVTGRPVIVDTFAGSNRVIDLERVLQNGESLDVFRGVTADGRLREEIVAGVMWDAFDGPSDAEPFDRVALGVEAVMAVLVDHFARWPFEDRGPSGIDLSDYLHALVCVAGVLEEDAARLAEDRAFPWSPAGCP